MSLKNELNKFTGTEQYHKVSIFSDLLATDGIIYLFHKAKCHWLGDIIASAQNKEEIKQSINFMVWRIIQTQNGAIVSAFSDSDENGNYPVSNELYKQVIEYTDFPFDKLGEEFEFYQCGKVLLLKSEY